MIGDRIVVDVPALAPNRPGKQHVSNSLRLWYEENAREQLAIAVERWSARTGLVPNGVRVKNLKRAWGICSPNNWISLNWRLVLAPMRVIDYIDVHELCHIKHKNHSAAFYKHVAAIQPDYLERRRCQSSSQLQCGR